MDVSPLPGTTTVPVSLATAPTTPVTSATFATAAKQPALGTAGSASADVISVQGIASGTAVAVTMAAIPTGGIALTDTFKTRSDTYTGLANGTTVDTSAAPLRSFAIQVTGTGAGATSWDVRLEGSLNNTNWSKILAHTNTTGNGEVLWSGDVNTPSLYIRSRTAGLLLGAASDIVVKILGVV